jgi:hypothetical protein
MLRLYKVFGVLALLVFAWVDFRGWAPGTEEEEAAASSSGSHERTIRSRTYRGGK